METGKGTEVQSPIFVGQGIPMQVTDLEAIPLGHVAKKQNGPATRRGKFDVYLDKESLCFDITYGLMAKLRLTDYKETSSI